MEFKRKRVLYRCVHRGMKEIDELLGSFTQHHLDSISDEMLVELEALLDESDNDLYTWITGYELGPRRFQPILEKIRKHHGVS